MTNLDDIRGPKVDLIAEAKAAQFNSNAAMRGYTKLIAPAKVNLFLEIGARREDGYHDAISIMHSLMLHDVVFLRRSPELEDAEEAIAFAGPKKNIRVRATCTPREGVAPLEIETQDNIVFKAIDKLACATSHDEADALHVHIEKHIPHQGGLGGGSSNAAATLVGVAKLWGIDPADPLVEQVARELGADVAFFLRGGCALLDDKGDRFCHALTHMKKQVVLVKPEGGVSTGAAYSAFDAAPPAIDQQAHDDALAATEASDIVLLNNLAPAAESLMPELAKVREWALAQEGVENALLCGSGATSFLIAKDTATARRIVAAAKAEGWWARSTMFCKLRATLADGSQA